MVKSMSAADQAKISAAIAAAEAGTDGEIVAITADTSDAYHDVGLHYAVGVLFLNLAAYAAWPGLFDWWWSWVAEWSAPLTLQQILTFVLVFALVKFLVVLFVMKWMPLRLALTPGAT